MAIRLSSETIAAQYKTPQVSSKKSSESVKAPSSANFQDKIAVSSTRSNFEQATEVSLSAGAQAAAKGVEKATRALSNATSYVDLASNAVSEVSSLLSRVKTNAESLENEVDPVKRQNLADEGAALLEEIDTVISSSELNGNSVFNAGTREFTFDLQQQQPTGDNTYTFAISSFDVSRSALGVSDLDSSALQSDPSAAIETIEAAEQQLVVTRQSVEKSKETINTVASEFGIDASQELRGERSLNADQAQKFADKIAESIQGSVVEATQAQELEAKRVEPLIVDDGEQEKLRAKAKEREDTAVEEGVII